MKPFAYKAPASLGDAVALLAEKGDRARPFAGGTDILVQLRDGRFDLDVLVDVKRIPELNQLSFDPVAGLTIGAAVPCCQVYGDPTIVARYPALIDSVSIIGCSAIQGRATMGGNLCNAAPSADSVPSMIVLGGVCNIVGPGGSRSVPVEKFNVSLGKTVLGPGELLVSISFPAPRPHSGARYERFIPRSEMDIAVVGAGAWVELDGDGSIIRRARLALATVAPTALLAEEASASLEGKPVSDEAIAAAADLAQKAARPRTTVRGTAPQRRHLVGVMATRATWGAIRRARGEKQDGR